MQKMVAIEMSPTLGEIAAVLAACGLPSDDIEPDFVQHFLVARDVQIPIGGCWRASTRRQGAAPLSRGAEVVPLRRAGLTIAKTRPS
jgi:hypothetical protein